MALAAYLNAVALTVLVIVTSERIILVSGRACPREIESATQQCLSNHHYLLQTIQQTEKHFFAGIDAEIIRNLCHDFKSRSMRCVNEIRLNCPESPERNVAFEAALRPYAAFISICYHQHFIEEYAIIQNCLYSRRASTDVCNQNFLSDTAGQEHRAWQNHHSAVLSYCRSLSELTSCVQSKTQSCDADTSRHKTSKLVSLLISVSVELSFKCFADSHGMTTPTSSTHRGSNSKVKTNFFLLASSAAATQMSTACLLYLTLLTVARLVRSAAA